MQSSKRKMKRIMNGMQNPMPNSSKLGNGSKSRVGVYRKGKYSGCN